MDFCGPQRLAAADALRLVRVSIAGGGFAFSVGFPLLRLRDVYLGRAVWTGYTVVEADEIDRLRRTCASPQVVPVWVPGQPNAAGKERHGP